MIVEPNTKPKLLTGLAAWWDTLFIATRKELLIMLRYPVELVASFAQIFLVVIVLTLAGLMFTKGGLSAAGSGSSRTAGLVVYGFILFMFLSDTLWGIGYNVRREQKQGTLEQLYLSPASKFLTLLSRIMVTLVWTGSLCVLSALVMTSMIGKLPFENLPLGLFVLVMALSGTFGVGFAFAALTLRVREAGQTLANLAQFAFMLLCAPFFPFSALPEWMIAITRFIPLSYGVDAFRSTLMGFPPGYPELAPIETELLIVTLFGLLMPLLGFWLYRQEENRARARGSLSEY
jgi:ABC-type polysaccharide/polyol phosphate export permease